MRWPISAASVRRFTTVLCVLSFLAATGAGAGPAAPRPEPPENAIRDKVVPNAPPVRALAPQPVLHSYGTQPGTIRRLGDYVKELQAHPERASAVATVK